MRTNWRVRPRKKMMVAKLGRISRTRVVSSGLTGKAWIIPPRARGKTLTLTVRSPASWAIFTDSLRAERLTAAIKTVRSLPSGLLSRGWWPRIASAKGKGITRRADHWTALATSSGGRGGSSSGKATVEGPESRSEARRVVIPWVDSSFRRASAAACR